MQGAPIIEPQISRRLAMTPGLRMAIGLLRLSNLEMAAHLARIATGNPRLEVLAPLASLIAALWKPEGPTDGVRPQPPRAAGGTADVIAATLPAGAAGLHEHAAGQARLLLDDPGALAIAAHFVEALEPSGWLGRPLAAIAADAGCDLAHAEAVLGTLQQAEPTGLFARDLAECLTLQALEAGLLTPAFAVVLANLPLLARGEMDALARLAGGSPDDVRAILRAIRAFDPKPGARFDPAPPPLREPDIVVRRIAGGWRVELNRSTLPALVVRTGDGGSGAEDAGHARAAELLAQGVARRNTTVLAVAQAAVVRQAPYLAHGPAALSPMRLADLAEDCGVHESTVSRVAGGLLLQTPQGMVTLRDLCGVGFDRGGQHEPIAAGAVRHRIAALVAAEPPHAPLSDSEIASRLARDGIRIARRTVAKYRMGQGISSAGARRARTRLDTPPR